MASLLHYHGSFYVRFKDSDGSWKRKSLGSSCTKAEAKALVAEYTAREFNRKHNKPIRHLHTTLTEALRSYRDDTVAKEKKAFNSILRERTILTNYLGYLVEHGHTRFEQHHLQDYFDSREAQGYASKTLHDELRVLKRFWKYALAEHHTDANPTASVRLPKLVSAPPRYFTREQLESIYRGSKACYRDVFQFMANSGLRSGEICNLQWSDWNELLQTITIRVVDGVRKYRRAGNKAKRVTSVPINDTCQQILRRRREAATSEYVFLNLAGNPLDTENIHHHLKVVLKHLGLEGHPHLLRHSFCSHLVMAGVPLYTVRDLARHASVTETERYAHLSNETLAKAANKICL